MTLQERYRKGFITKCAQAGVDPLALLYGTHAKPPSNPPSKPLPPYVPGVNPLRQYRYGGDVHTNSPIFKLTLNDIEKALRQKLTSEKPVQKRQPSLLFR